jgi:O-antigen/teichoic acid export membrane protein
VGTVSVIAAAFAISSVIGDSGLDAAATVHLSAVEGSAERRSLTTAIVQTRCALAGSVMVALVAATVSTPTAVARGGFALLAAAAALVQSVAAGMRLSLRINEPTAEAKALVIERSVVSIAFLALAAVGLNPGVAYLTAWVVGPALSTILRPEGRLIYLSLADRVDRAPAIGLLKSAAPFAISAIAAVLYWRLDVVFLQHYRGSAAVGTYTYGYYPVMAISVIPGSAALLMLRGRSSREDNLRQVTSAAFMGLIGAAVLAGPFAAIVHRSLPNEFTPAAVHVLRIAAIGLPAIWVNPQIAALLRATGYARQMVLVSLGALAANVIGNALVIPRHGAIGAAIVSTGTELVATVLLVPLVVVAYWADHPSVRKAMGSPTPADQQDSIVGIS